VSDSWDGNRLIGLRSDLDELELIGNNLFTVGVPVDADPEFKAYVFAAGATHSSGNRSVDNMLRRHCDSWVKRFEDERSSDVRGVQSLRKVILEKASGRSMALAALDLNGNVNYGVRAAANAQIRLESTFRAALQLVQLGYAFESEAVIRLGLEQVAWTYAIRNLATPGEVEATSGTGWIPNLKEVIPGAGRIYGRLSNLAHVSPATHSRFVAHSDGQTMIRIKAPAAAMESLLLLIILLDAFLVISERCFGSNGITCESIDPNTGKLLEERVAQSLISDFEGILPPGSKDLFLMWWKA